MDVKSPANPVDRAFRRHPASDNAADQAARRRGRVGRRAGRRRPARDRPAADRALTDVLIQAGDKGLRLKVVSVLGWIAKTEQVRDLCALGSAFKAVEDPDVRMTMIEAMLGMRTIDEQAAQAAPPGPGPPGGGPTPGAVAPGVDNGPEYGLLAGRRQRSRSGV